jgi:hypothetical protein
MAAVVAVPANRSEAVARVAVAAPAAAVAVQGITAMVSFKCQAQLVRLPPAEVAVAAGGV